MALQDENARLKEEIQKGFMQGADTQDETRELVAINNGLTAQIKKLQDQLLDEKKIARSELASMKK